MTRAAIEINKPERKEFRLKQVPVGEFFMLSRDHGSGKPNAYVKAEQTKPGPAGLQSCRVKNLSTGSYHSFHDQVSITPLRLIAAEFEEVP